MNWLFNVPEAVLCHIALFLSGFDVLSFGECISNNNIMNSDRDFWRSIRM